MKRNLQGNYVGISTVGEKAQAFIPAPLPPVPPIDESAKLRDKFDQAQRAIGYFAGISLSHPNTQLLIYMHVRKEAVLSSMIEGIQSSLNDLLLFECKQQTDVPIDDKLEVWNYVYALNHGVMRLNEGFPLSLRLLREIHRILLTSGRGSKNTPGEFRRSQNWIGGSRPGMAVFVPPPAESIVECMGKLELFLHNRPETTSTLIKVALAHIQFETDTPIP